MPQVAQVADFLAQEDDWASTKGSIQMQHNSFHRVVATFIVAVSVGFSACGGSASTDSSGATANAAGKGAPSGTYESKLPDGTAIQLRFSDGGAVVISMTEDGKTDAHDGKWILNGEVILIEGGEGMVMQLGWRGDVLVTDFGGATLTFNKK
jgi:hypothetical protein